MEVNQLVRKKKFKGEITYKGIFSLFHRQIRQNEYILDVGAGNGHLVQKINQKFRKQAIGIDLVPESESVIQGDITQMAFPDNHFGAIICTDVIEHLSTEILSKGLKEIYRVLSPKGSFLVTTLLEENLDDLACKCPDCGKIFHRIGHVQTFSRKELTEYLEMAGFTIKSVDELHLGAFSISPTAFTVLKRFRFAHFMPPSIKRLFSKDIAIICSK